MFATSWSCWRPLLRLKSHQQNIQAITVIKTPISLSPFLEYDFDFSVIFRLVHFDTELIDLPFILPRQKISTVWISYHMIRMDSILFVSDLKILYFR